MTNLFVAGAATAMWTAVGAWFLVPFEVNPMKVQIVLAFVLTLYLVFRDWRFKRQLRKRFLEAGYPPPPKLKESDAWQG